MGPIEYALFAEAARLDGSELTHSPHASARFDYLAQAVAETCREFGMQDDLTSCFLSIIAAKAHDLRPELKRRALRRVERQIMRALASD